MTRDEKIKWKGEQAKRLEANGYRLMDLSESPNNKESQFREDSFLMFEYIREIDNQIASICIPHGNDTTPAVLFFLDGNIPCGEWL